MLWLLALLLTAASAQVAVEVTNQDELFSAMQSKVEQIMLTQHIELDETIPPNLSGASVAIWGNCKTPVDAQLLGGVPSQYIKDGACSISAPGNTLFYAVGSKIWLSNLALTGPAANRMQLALFAWDSSVWMVDMVVTGSEYEGTRVIDSDFSIVDSAFVQNYNLPETFGLAVRFDVGEDPDTDNFFVSGSYFAASDWSSHAPLYTTNMAGMTVDDLVGKSQIVNSEQDTVVVISDNTLLGARTMYGTCFGLCLKYSDGEGKAPTIYSDLPTGDYNQIANQVTDVAVQDRVPTEAVDTVTLKDLTQVAGDGDWLASLEEAGVPGTDKAQNPLGLAPPDPLAPPKSPKPSTPGAPMPPGMNPSPLSPPGSAPSPSGDSTSTDTNTAGSPSANAGSTSGSSSKKKPSVALIIIVTMASVVGCVALVALAVLLAKRRRSYEKAHDEQMTWNSAASISTPIERAGYEAGGQTADTTHIVTKPYSSYNPIHGSSLLTATADITYTEHEHNVTLTKRHIMGDPNVDVAVIKTEIHEMLDSYDARNASFQQYKFLPGFVNRREGGQGVVAFATSYLNQHTWAVKFFAVERQFNEERAMYENGQLRHVLPEVRDIDDNKDERLVAPNGVVVPPYIILACGQAFDEWCRSISPDFPLALQVLLHIAKKLQQIHAAGFAHRDVKPSNVILESQSKQWILIDYASAAPIGETCPVAYTLRYAAPEVARAVEENRSSMEVSGAVDVWALGIMAWTLLTGSEPFAGCQTRAEIFDKMMGRSPLPWETNLDRETRGKLGILFPSIRAMLTRDPNQRATIPDLLKAWQRLFQSQETTTQTTSHHAGAYR